jgi:hypothetical protein
MQPTSTDTSGKAALRDMIRDFAVVAPLTEEFRHRDPLYGMIGAEDEPIPEDSDKIQVPDYLKNRSVQVALGTLGAAGTVLVGYLGYNVAETVIPPIWNEISHITGFGTSATDAAPVAVDPMPQYGPTEYQSLIDDIATFSYE